MSKKTRQLLVVLAVVLVLGIGVGVLSLLPSDSGSGIASSKPTSSTSSQGTVYLYQHEEKEIQQFELKNEFGTFVINATSDKNGKRTYVIEGYEGLNVSNSIVSNIAGIAKEVVVLREIGKTSALADFGLKDPVATLTTKLANGKDVTLLLGDTLNSNEKHRYAMVKGEDTVVVIAANDLVSVKPTSLLSTVLINATVPNETDGTEKAPNFKSIRISGRGHDMPIEIYRVPEDVKETDPLKLYAYYIKGAVNIPVSSNAPEKFFLNMCSVNASAIEVVNPTEEEKTKYGFDDPIYLTFETVGENSNDTDIEKHSIRVGTINEDGTAYAMLENVNVIYVVSMDALEIVTMSVHDMRDTLLYIIPITTVEKVTVKVKGETYEFLRERVERKSSSSATSSSNKVLYDYETYYNGELMTMFGLYYQQFLAGYKQEEFTEDMRRGKLMIEMKLEYFDEFNQKPTVYRVYECEGNERRAVFEVNGEVQSLVKMSWAEKFIEDTDRVLNGEEIIVTA